MTFYCFFFSFLYCILYTSVGCDFSIWFLGTGRVWFHFRSKQFFKLPLQINTRKQKKLECFAQVLCFRTNAKTTCNGHFWLNRCWIASVSAPLCVRMCTFSFCYISRNSPNSRPSDLNWLEIYVRNKFYQKLHLCVLSFLLFSTNNKYIKAYIFIKCVCMFLLSKGRRFKH